MAHPLHVKRAVTVRDVKITTDNLVIVTRSFPLRQKPHTSTLSLPQVSVQHKLERLGDTQASEYLRHRVGWGWRKGNEHQGFIQCSPLKPLTVAERLVNSVWAQSPL